MSYRFVAGEPVAIGVKRIAAEQLDRAIEALSPPFQDHGVAVHDARKSMKKLRAILRLVGDEIGREEFADHNRAFRDAARRLSEIRDAAVLPETLRKLREEKGKGKLDAAFDRAMSLLEPSALESGDQDRKRQQTEGAMKEVAGNLLRIRLRVEDWSIERNDFRALRGGIRKVYKRGRKGFAEALDEPTAANLHEWRKQVKYLWYQVRLLRGIWPPLLKSLAEELRELAEELGEDHDLAMLRDALAGLMADDTAELEMMVKVIEKRRAKLQERAMMHGSRIFAERPKAFAGRLEGYWSAWRNGRK